MQETDTWVRLGSVSLGRVFRKSHADKVTFRPGPKDRQELTPYKARRPG